MATIESEVSELAPVEVARREIEQSEDTLRRLKRELAGLPDARAEATAAMDAEALSLFDWRGTELKSEIRVNELLLRRRRLNLLELELVQLDEADRELLDQMSDISRLWHQAMDRVNELEAEHQEMVIERRILGARAKSNEEQQRIWRRQIQ